MTPNQFIPGIALPLLLVVPEVVGPTVPPVVVSSSTIGDPCLECESEWTGTQWEIYLGDYCAAEDLSSSASEAEVRATADRFDTDAECCATNLVQRKRHPSTRIRV